MLEPAGKREWLPHCVVLEDSSSYKEKNRKLTKEGLRSSPGTLKKAIQAKHKELAKQTFSTIGSLE